ncbi:MAG TPA: PEP-CTERM sorting domain-containing protein [Chthoniobacterales bacterium]
MYRVILLTVLAASTGPAFAASWVIGDNDGYGIGIADNANHPFNGFNAGYDGRSPAEVAATNGAQYTDTYSTTHGSYGPQPGTVATFTFSGLGVASPWTSGTMIFDMADFQASTFGPVIASFNGVVQNWAFNDGFPFTKLRVFDLEQSVLNQINLTGQLVVVVDRNASGDFYGFDYAALTNTVVTPGDVPVIVPVIPEPGTCALTALGLGVASAFARRRRD